MAEIKVNVTAGKQQKVTVSSTQNSTEISASPDTGRFWAQNAKNWAVSENIVDGEDYSSKHYANVSKNHAENAKNYLDTTIENYNNFIDQSSDALGQITELKDVAIEDINSTKTTILNDIEFVADGEKKEIEELADLIKENAEEIANRTSFAMFDTILKDHVLTYEESKGLALQGTYVYKEAIAGSRYGYPDFYNKCLEERNTATATEVALGNSTITMYIASNGHQYYDITNKDTIDAFFGTMGTAWFYGVDTENEKIFLPRNNYFEQATGDISEVGKSVEAGLPNIEGRVGQIRSNTGGNSADSNQALRWVSKSGTGGNALGTGNSSGYDLKFNASWSNPIYGNSDTVQPNAVKKLLYICVGNTTNYEGMTEVVNQGMEILEQVNEGIATRADGQFVLKRQLLSTATAIGEYIYDLSDYLPVDSYDYEVQFEANVNQISGVCSLRLAREGELDTKFVDMLIAQGGWHNGHATLKVGTDRKIYGRKSNEVSASFALYAVSYRRLGTNQ